MKELWFKIYQSDMPKFTKAARIFEKKFSTSYTEEALAEKMLMEKVNEILKNQK